MHLLFRVAAVLLMCQSLCINQSDAATVRQTEVTTKIAPIVATPIQVPAVNSTTVLSDHKQTVTNSTGTEDSPQPRLIFRKIADGIEKLEPTVRKWFTAFFLNGILKLFRDHEPSGNDKVHEIAESITLSKRAHPDPPPKVQSTPPLEHFAPVKRPNYYRLGAGSTLPDSQSMYRVPRYLEAETDKYLVDSHDFDPQFIETIYVNFHESVGNILYDDSDIQSCNPCNGNYNTDYPRLNDWNERYITCHSYLPFSERSMLDSRIVNGRPNLCLNDIKYEKNCNPCGHAIKIAVVAAGDSQTRDVFLPFKEITKRQETFFDEDGNKYEFTSLKSHNLDFDAKYGDPLPDNYDTSQLYRYFAEK